MNRSLAPWRPARMGATRVMGLKPTTCYAISAVGSAVTSTLAIEAWERYDPAQGPLFPAMIGFIPWGIVGVIVAISKNDGPLGLGIAASGLGGSTIALFTHLFLG